MKTNKMILPMVCCIPLMNSCAVDKPMEKPAWNIQPVYKVNNIAADNPNTLYQLGRYYQGQRRYKLAVESYRKALAVDDGFVEAHNGLGVIYSMQGQFDAAVIEFKSAINLAPKSGHLYNNLGHTLYLQGAYAEAVSTLEQAVNLEPGNARALNNLGLAYVKAGEVAKSRQAFVNAAKPISEEAIQEPGTLTKTDAEQAVEVGASASQAATTPESITVQAATTDVPSVQAPEPTLQTLALPKDRGVIISAPVATSPDSNIETPVAEAQIVPYINKSVELKLTPVNVTAPEAQATGKIVERSPTGVTEVQSQLTTAMPLDSTLSSMSSMPLMLGHLEVSNGNGTAGMARKVANYFQENGYGKARLTNRKPFTVKTTQIQYRYGHQADAEYIRASFPDHLHTSAALVQNNNLRDDINLRVILGRDLVQHTAYFNGSPQKVLVTRNELNI